MIRRVELECCMSISCKWAAASCQSPATTSTKELKDSIPIMSPTLAYVVFGLYWKPGYKIYCQVQTSSIFFSIKTYVSNLDSVSGRSITPLSLGRFGCGRGGRVVGPNASRKGSSCQHHIPQHYGFEEANNNSKVRIEFRSSGNPRMICRGKS